MRSCKEVTELLSNAMDRELPALTRLGLRLHVMICPPCARYKSQLGRLRAMCRSAGDTDDGPVLPAAVASRLQHEIDDALNRNQT